MDADLYRDLTELNAGMGRVLQSPRKEGVVDMIVRRPAVDEREVVEEAELDPVLGLVGDNWKHRGSAYTPDGLAHPGKQLTLMNSRVIDLVAGDRGRWPLAGDQFFVDLDLSAENLPPGTRLKMGAAELEITPEPHTGCKKFVMRYGVDALKLLNSAEGRRLNLRGVYARVVGPGAVRAGDRVLVLG